MRSTDCTAAPLADRAAPERNASTTLGILMSVMMFTVVMGIFSGSCAPKKRTPMAVKISPGEMFTEPIPIPSTIETTAQKSAQTIGKCLLRYIHSFLSSVRFILFLFLSKIMQQRQAQSQILLQQFLHCLPQRYRTQGQHRRDRCKHRDK